MDLPLGNGRRSLIATTVTQDSARGDGKSHWPVNTDADGVTSALYVHVRSVMHLSTLSASSVFMESEV